MKICLEYILENMPHKLLDIHMHVQERKSKFSSLNVLIRWSRLKSWKYLGPNLTEAFSFMLVIKVRSCKDFNPAKVSSSDAGKQYVWYFHSFGNE